ncbi:IPT/TIG domain-containing protein [Patescibacteria group bacterium]|nr:IPT/TIG domain-containing protein [Patescibacteria group bacterium]
MKILADKNKIKVFIGLLILSISFGILFFSASQVFAQGAGDTFQLEAVGAELPIDASLDIRVIIARIIRAALGLLGVVAIGIVLYGGFMYMTSGGVEDKVATAKKILINGTIGLAIILSSFAIAQFVLSSLSDATGIGGTDDDGGNDNPIVVITPTGEEVCDAFVVKSITPSTVGSDPGTGMSNVVVRAIFSKPMHPTSTVASEVVSMTAENTSFSLIDSTLFGGSSATGYYGVQAIFAIPSSTPLNTKDQLLNIDTYSVFVNENLTDAVGEPLLVDPDECDETYPMNAEFKVDDLQIDDVPPVISNMRIDGYNGMDNVLLAGRGYDFRATIADESGTGYGYLEIFRDDEASTSGRVGTDRAEFFNGPRIRQGSSADYTFRATIETPGAASELPAHYSVNMSAYDIDSNVDATYSSFIVVGEWCQNGVLDGDETSTDRGGSCLSDGGCSEDWQCASGKCQVDDDGVGQCIPWPKISGADPWDGAPGNWVTIVGDYFGTERGQVDFGAIASDGSISWIPAVSPVECSLDSVWNDEWAIVSVPEGIEESNIIRITRSDDPTAQDTSTDDHGNRPGPNNGLFSRSTVERPGLCSVLTVGTEAKTAEPGTQVLARGKGFGSSNGSLIFATTNAEITSWSDTLVQADVPETPEDGWLGVTVKNSNNEVSNGIPFNVTNNIADIQPEIDSVDPTTTTPGSFFTINGRRFGNVVGEVWLAGSSSAVKTCLSATDRDQSCVQVEVNLPSYCGTGTWQDDQVIAIAPEVTAGTYNLILKNRDGLGSDGEDQLAIENGVILPGICSVDPAKGPAPLPIGHSGLRFLGVGFSSDPTIYFFKRDADIYDISTWLEVTSSSPEFLDVNRDGIRVSGLIPVDENGKSMPTGPNPIKIANNLGRFSNSVNYTVEDCRAEGSNPPGSNYRCCTTDEDAGFWKDESLACAGENRTAGYVWRFTTGKFPQVPYVLEACNAEDWADTEASSIDYPSPTPWVEWRSGKNVCLNANIAVRFSMPMVADSTVDEKSVRNTDNVKLFSCADSGGDIDCDTVHTEVSNLDLNYESGNDVLEIWESVDGHTLSANTWYRVEISKNVNSQELTTAGGLDVELNEPLQVTRSCSADTAYCFDFKTSETGETCVLQAVDVQPPAYTTKYLGLIQNQRKDPLYFYLMGRGNQECISIEVDGLGWQWLPGDAGDTDYLYAEATGEAGSGHTDDRSTVLAKVQTEPTVDITALWELSRSTGDPIEVKTTDLLEEMGVLAGSDYEARDVEDIVTISDFDFDSNLRGSEEIEVSFTLDPLSDAEMTRVGSGGSVYYSKYRYVFDKIGAYSFYVRDEHFSTGKRRDVFFEFKDNNFVSHNVIDVNVDGIDDQTEPVQYNYRIVISGKKVELYSDNELKRTYIMDSEVSISQNENPMKVGSRGVDVQELNNLLIGSIQNFNFTNSIYSADLGFDEISSKSILTIDLDDPKVISSWPQCSEACINAEIGARFNQIMASSTYAGNIIIEKCADELCTSILEDVITPNIKPDRTNERQVVFGSDDLEANSWYRVTLTSDILAVGAILPSGAYVNGENLEEYQWKFKTKNDATPCVISSVAVTPDPFIAHLIGERTKYVVLAVGSPDSCSEYGQVLDSWGYGWSWSVGSDLTADRDDVAQVTQFEYSGGKEPWCGLDCLPLGSDIKRLASFDPAVPSTLPALCGNGALDPGEDCDLGMSGETLGEVGVSGSCTINCLRTGASLTCGVADGDGGVTVEPLKGEECEIGVGGDTAETCSATCLNLGSSQEAVVGEAYCGGGSISPGEDCDRGISTIGCSEKCLHTGTQLSQKWCDNANSGEIACRNAVSVCGNGEIENGEECELDFGEISDVCTDSCLLVNACDGFSQCTSGDEGCNDDCTWAGSSINYSVPSVCGNGDYNGDGGTPEIGEYPGCDPNRPAGDGYEGIYQNPSQLVTAIGLELADEDGRQITEINATAVAYMNAENIRTPLATDIEGVGEYALQCGNVEYDTPVDTGANIEYNDCPNTDRLNIYGVSSDTCCRVRPVRVLEYPATNNVCLNTSISATFEANIDEVTVNNNIFVASIHDSGYDCASGGETMVPIGDLTDRMVNSVYIAMEEDGGFWQEVWGKIKGFFASIFGQRVNADAPVWCKGGVSANISVAHIKGDGGAVTNTTISLNLLRPLSPDTTYAVVLKGGNKGIRDMEGVGIKNKYTSEILDSWQFTTKSSICKLDHIEIDQPYHVFYQPETSSDFIAQGISRNGQNIGPMPGYSWEWDWSPNDSEIFDIPETAEATIAISSTLVEGQDIAVVSATVTEDASTDGTSDVGNIYTASTKLYSWFCANFWPSVDFYNDTDFNFQMRYCADNGNPLTRDDDLPIFEENPTINIYNDREVLADGTIKRVVFFGENETNDDAIGYQVFTNPNFLSLREWYREKFGADSSFSDVSVDGYSAITDGNNYYISALNEGNDGTIFNNIYLFSINAGAQVGSQVVFADMMQSLTFNTNINDLGYCMSVDVFRLDLIEGLPVPLSLYTESNLLNINDEFSCSSHFDCRSTTNTPKFGTNGVCSNARTALQRDWQRLQELQNAQETLDAVHASTGFYPSLDAGTYYPGYTSSRWPSWGLLGGVATDPLNMWTECGASDQQTCWDVSSRAYNCPAYPSIYEYAYTSSTGNYVLHAELEYINSTNDLILGYTAPTPSRGILPHPNYFSAGPWCVNQVRNPFVSTCGDGMVNIATEQCDPPGKIVRESCDLPGGTDNGRITRQCNSSCQWVTSPEPVCLPAYDCGNGRVEGTETCDDGRLNGTYGHCAGEDSYVGEPERACHDIHPQYCGNDSLDFDDNDSNGDYDVGVDRALEFCDEQGGTCEFIVEDVGRVEPSVYILLDKSGSMNKCINMDEYPSSYNDYCNYGSQAAVITRWSEALSAIDSFINESHAQINLGIAVWGESCSEPDQTLSVGVYENVVDALIYKDGVIPTGGTPTAEAVAWVKDNINSIFVDDDTVDPLNDYRSRNLILITDGPPSTGCGDSTLVKNTIKSLHLDYDVVTHVIGYTTDFSDLNLWAVAGATETAKSASDATGLFSVLRQVLPCDRYSPVSGGSCASDCQSFGSYCGDGITNSEYEECDDKNDDNGDSCRNNCTINEDPEGPSVAGGYCGDGTWQSPNGDGVKEKCDQGLENGIVCTPTRYGEGCVYCSVDCKNLLTVDALAFCGNGKVDGDEVCDIDDGEVIVAGGNISCDDKGQATCTDNCTKFDDGCVECILSEDPLKGAIPRISILNVAETDGNTGVGSWGDDTIITLARSLSSFDPGVANKYFVRKVSLPPNYNSLFNLADPGPPPERLETDMACDGLYRVAFNSYSLSAGSSDWDIASLLDWEMASTTSRSAFDYSVNGEAGVVTNELVVSPAVPDGVFRIVARWTDEESRQNVKFSTMAYSEAFAGEGEQSIVGYTRGLTPIEIGSRGERVKYERICADIKQRITGNNGYWWPDDLKCKGFFDSFDSKVFVHDMVNLNEIFVHSLTIDTNQISGEYKPIAIFVEAISASSSRPIYEFRNSDLVLEVYTYHPDQVPKYSIYKPDPDYVYEIKDAAGTSSNPLAKYWHVFNLEYLGIRHGGYRIVPVKSIETGFCQIRENLGESCSSPPPVDGGDFMPI